MSLQDTLGNEKWLQENEQAIKEMLPKTWTHMENLNVFQISFKLKLLGVDWRSEQDFGKIMVYLEKIGIMLRDGFTIRANSRSIFK